MPTPGSPSTASHSPDLKTRSTSWQACSHGGPEPTMLGSGAWGSASRERVASLPGWSSTTCATTPEGWLPVPMRRQYIRACSPEESSTVTVPRRAESIASVACARSVDWSAGASEARAWSLSMTTSLSSANTIPVVRLQVRRYSWKSSSWDALASASSARRICSAVVLARVSSSVPASLRQQVRSTAPTRRPVTGWWIGTPAQASSSRFSA